MADRAKPLPPVWDSWLAKQVRKGPGMGLYNESGTSNMSQFDYAAKMDEPGYENLAMLMGMLGVGAYGARQTMKMPPNERAIIPITGIGTGGMMAPIIYNQEKAILDPVSEFKKNGPSWSQEVANEQLFGKRLTIPNIIEAIYNLGWGKR